VSFFALRTAEALIRGIVTNQLENVAADKQVLVERWLGERRADLAVVAGAGAVRTADAQSERSYLNLLREQYQVYNRFIVVDSAGHTRADTAESPESQHSETAWYLAAMAGRRYMSQVHLGEGREESVFEMAEPLFGPDGCPSGAVCATVSTTSILDSVLRVSLGRTGECYLVDRTGTFLVHADPRRILRDNIAGSGSFDLVVGLRGSNEAYMDYRNIQVLGAGRPIAGADWYVVVEQDEAEAFAPSRILRHSIFAVIVLAAVAAVGVSLALARYVAAPVRRLSNAAKALAAGDFDQASPGADAGRRDEIGELHRAFGDMAEQLRARQIVLQQSVARTQAELEQSDLRLQHTMEAAARSEHLAAMGRVASGVAHEIRTPLASLKLYLQSLQDDVTLSPDLSEDLDVAMHQVERIEKTVNHFLSFARPEQPVRAAVDVRRLIEEVLMVIRPRAVHQEVDVEVSMAPRLPCVVGDMRQLADALINLMVNALEEMPHGGRLTISSRSELADDESPHPLWLRIDVSDTGPGIREADLEKLFEPFYTTKASGSGLGLAIVRGTVQRHDGRIRLRSSPGAGATFSLYFPAASSGASAHGETADCRQ
jgi:signal transduction histidine kinase